MDFKPEDKQEMEFGGNYFSYGVHKVKILGFEEGVTEAGKHYVEAMFCDPNDASIADKARVWFTTDKAKKYSFNILKAIAIHNTPEAKRDVARASIDKVNNLKELVDLLNSKIIDKEMWFTKYVSDSTYTHASGNVKNSVDRNILPYEPALDETKMPKQSKPATTADVQAVFESDASVSGWN